MECAEDLIARYQRDGFVVVEDLIPERIIDEALYGVDRHHAGERDTRLPSGLGYLDWHPGDPPGVRINDYASLQNNQIRGLVTYRALAAMAALLSGSATIRLFHDQIIFKDPASDVSAETKVGFHTDRAYWQTCSSTEMLTAWIPLTPCTVESGPLAVVRGSHRWPGNDGLAGFFPNEGAGLLDNVKVPPGSSPDVVTLTLQPGQVSFHHCGTVHGSSPNRSPTNRCAATVHFQDASNRYVTPAKSGRRTLHVNDLLCRRGADGLPDYTDPFVSPVLFAGTPSDAIEIIEEYRVA